MGTKPRPWPTSTHFCVPPPPFVPRSARLFPPTHAVPRKPSGRHSSFLPGDQERLPEDPPLTHRSAHPSFRSTNRRHVSGSPAPVPRRSSHPPADSPASPTDVAVASLCHNPHPRNPATCTSDELPPPGSGGDVSDLQPPHSLLDAFLQRSLRPIHRLDSRSEESQTHLTALRPLASSVASRPDLVETR